MSSLWGRFAVRHLGHNPERHFGRGEREAPKPYCAPEDHSWVRLVGGRGYSEDFVTNVCIRCDCHHGIRKEGR